MNKLKNSSSGPSEFSSLLNKYLELSHSSNILEIGAGPNPVFSTKQIKDSNATYHLNDFSQEELEKGSNDFLKIPGDFSKLQDLEKYDLVVSKMVLEHVKKPKEFHQKIFDHLNPGGVVIHYYATLYSLPALFNQILPEFLSDSILKWAQKRNEELEGKFPAYYRWCRGPRKSNQAKFENIGFQIIEHHGFLGHGYLSSKRLLWPLEKSYNHLLLKLNSPFFCSNAILVLQKPS